MDRAIEDEAADDGRLRMRIFLPPLSTAARINSMGILSSGCSGWIHELRPYPVAVCGAAQRRRRHQGLGCHTGATLGLVLRGALVLFGAVTRSLSFLP